MGHLIITRKLGQTFVIGNDIRVTVEKLERGQVSLGVRAPRDLLVYREELQREIDAYGHRHNRPVYVACDGGLRCLYCHTVVTSIGESREHNCAKEKHAKDREAEAYQRTASREEGTGPEAGR